MPRLLTVACITLVAFSAACQSTNGGPSGNDEEAGEVHESTPADGDLEVATLAGGCFWCMQPPFDDLEGVDSTVVGYTGGDRPEPTYNEVAGGHTDHTEAVEVRYDPDEISYEQILDVFWRSHDPTDLNGQFADRGSQYRPAIFYHDDQQRQIAEDSKQQLDEEGPFDEPVRTSIEPAETFWVAEEYHQDYYKKNPAHYQNYYEASGRAGFLDEMWGDDR